MFFRHSTGGLLLGIAAALAVAPRGWAWDYDGHRLITQLSLSALPREYPQFVHAVANAERVTFLSGEPDRWRNVPDLPLRHAAGGDHYCDVEYIPAAGLSWATVSPFRLEFAVQFAAGRAAHAANFRPIDPARNADRTREWPGFAPWAIAEQFGRLRSAFSYLRTFEELGQPDEILNAQANVLYVMGVLAHFVGDCAQPLHTTKHHNGWVGDNPRGYTTSTKIHAWLDGGLTAKAGITVGPLFARMTPAEPIPLAPREDGRDPMFVAVVEYLLAQHAQVEPIYQLERDGKLGLGEPPVAPEARALVEGQYLAAARMLAAIWLTASSSAVTDTFLQDALGRRQARPAAPLRAP
jgi:hypothetical protein